jgi:hypothetical protein
LFPQNIVDATEEGLLEPQEEIEPPFLDSKLKRRVSFQVHRETWKPREKRCKTIEGKHQ